VAVAMVKTQKLRPKGFPAFFGNDFFLIGYRVFVRYTTSEGKKLRGLYILKSETNSKKMSFMGNIFTHYNYTTIDVGITNTPTSIEITSQKAKLLVKTDFSSPEIALPSNSPFKDWKEARRFAGPLPFTFTYNQVSKEVLLIEGVRQDWIPKPVSVLADSVGYLQTLNFKKIVLANAFIVQNIPYHWKKGKIDIWKG
jgi:hypothetical protein